MNSQRISTHEEIVRASPRRCQRRAEVTAGPAKQAVRPARSRRALEAADEVVVLHDRQQTEAAESLERARAQPDRRVAVVDAGAALKRVPRAEQTGEPIAAVEPQPEVAAEDGRVRERAHQRRVRVGRKPRVGVQEQKDVAAGACCACVDLVRSSPRSVDRHRL
jgi:hypothetical protein